MQIPIIRRNQFGSIPKINWAHSIARGLAFCITGSAPFYDLTGNCKATITGNPAFATTQEGAGLWVGDRSGTYASLTNYVTFSSPQALFTGGNATFLVRCNPLVYPTPNGVYTGALAYGKATDVIYSLSIAGNSGNTTFEVQNSGGSYQDAPTVVPPSTGVVHQLAGVINGATTSLYVDGVGSSTSYTGTPKSGDASYSIGLGLDWYNSDPNRVIDGIIPFAAIWTRALTSAELLQLNLDPYCFLIYPEDTIFATLVGSSSATPSGTLAATDTPDTAAFTGTFSDQGALAVTETTDTAAFTGSFADTGVLAVTDTQDTAAFTGTFSDQGVLSVTETPDVAAFNGTFADQGVLGVTEPTDIASFIGGGVVSGTLAVTETADTAAFTGDFSDQGILLVTETADIAAFTGSFSDQGVLSVTEAPDIAFFNGVTIFGALAVTEDPDIALFVSQALAGGGWKKWGYDDRPKDLRDEIKQAAAVLSSMGGHARAKALTANQRYNIASNAAKARWK